jgi:Replication initiator protein A
MDELLAQDTIDAESSAVPVTPNIPQSVKPLPPKVSRDEMNLAEFPLTVLSKRVDPSIKTLEFSDTVKGKNGDVINRKWIITGADKFGLPTSSDDEVLLGLLKLTADDGLRSQKVYFTRYELLRVLRWTTEGRSYARLQNALDRLSGVRIKATNAFYDNETKLHSTRNFGILDAYEINDGRDTRPSFFAWSEVLFKSFQVGFIKKLDLDFYLDLQSAVSKRLYRYLDKHFWYRSRMQVNLFVLAHEKIGISRNYMYASSLRQQLEPALEELRDKGLLAEYEFVGKGKATDVILVAAHAPRKTALEAATTTFTVTEGSQPRSGPAVSTPAAPSSVGQDTEESLTIALVQRGIAEKQARKLVEGRGIQVLERIEAIVSHFDKLVSAGSHLVSRNPQGFLYRATEKPFDFVLPGDKVGVGPRAQNELKLEARNSDGVKPVGKSKENNVDAEVSYLIERKAALDKLRSDVDPQQVAGLRAEVETALAKLKAHISPQRFEEAVEHGVEQRLLEQRGFPDFDKWCKSH